MQKVGLMTRFQAKMTAECQTGRDDEFPARQIYAACGSVDGHWHIREGFAKAARIGASQPFPNGQ